jgi:hypothetical protein
LGPERQRGRLLELPILGAVLVVVGVWLTRYHWSGILLAALPIVVWLWLLSAGMTTGLRRRRAIRARLAALQAEGFVATLLCKGDLSRGEHWAASDGAQVKILSAEAVRSFDLSLLKSVHVDEATRLGDSNPLYYSVSLSFPDFNASIVTTSRTRAQRWAREIKGGFRPPTPGVAA